MDTPVKQINRPNFYTKVRQTFGGLSQLQVLGFEAILNEWEKRGLTDVRWLAYILATAWHETGKTMQPVEEGTKGKGLPYGQKLKMGGGPGHRIPYTTPDKIYYGRGLVQLTWYENYQAMGKLLGVDLLNHPELACNLSIAVKITFEGMLKGESKFGDFTGRCLEQYFNDTTCDWLGARKIINGTDCNYKIKGYALAFLNAFS